MSFPLRLISLYVLQRKIYLEPKCTEIMSKSAMYATIVHVEVNVNHKAALGMAKGNGVGDRDGYVGRLGRCN